VGTNTTTSCVSLPSNLQQGLVGFWPFCGNANDESGNGNDGTVNGATLTEDRFGNAEAAYDFDGEFDYISISASPSLSITGNISVSLWFKRDSMELSGLLLDRDICGVASDWSLGYENGNCWIRVADPSMDYLLISNIDQLDIWNNLIFTKDGNQFKVFLNGVLSTEMTINSNPFVNDNQSIFVGEQVCQPNSINSPNFDGKIDDIGIWNRALTLEEVQELYTLDACTFTIYDTVYTYETIYDTVTTYITVTDTLLIDITFTGFEGQPSWLNTVTVFPNPASDHITIDYGNFALMAGYNTIITDAAGATIYSSAVNSQQAYIDINGWGAAGVYYMTIYDASGAAVAVRHIVLE
jgi:hypothetical protein